MKSKFDPKSGNRTPKEGMDSDEDHFVEEKTTLNDATSPQDENDNTDDINTDKEVYPIEFEHLTYYPIRQIGSGGFGTIFLYQTKDNFPQEIAVKIFKNIDPNRQQAEKLTWEKMGYRVALKTDERQSALIMPYFGDINLLNHLKNFIRNNTGEIKNEKKILQEILQTFIYAIGELEHIHSLGLIHFDAYYDNFLYQNEKTYLVDFDKLLPVKNYPENRISDVSRVFSSLDMIREFLPAFGIQGFQELNALFDCKDQLFLKDPKVEDKRALLAALKKTRRRSSYRFKC